MIMIDRESQRVWNFDPAYTTVEFSIRNLWFKVKGRFRDLEGAIVLDDDDISRSSVNATIRAGSIVTGNKQRDAHLLLKSFFDVENFPEIAFKSTRVGRGKDRDRGWKKPGLARDQSTGRSKTSERVDRCPARRRGDVPISPPGGYAVGCRPEDVCTIDRAGDPHNW